MATDYLPPASILYIRYILMSEMESNPAESFSSFLHAAISLTKLVTRTRSKNENAIVVVLVLLLFPHKGMLGVGILFIVVIRISGEPRRSL